MRPPALLLLTFVVVSPSIAVAQRAEWRRNLRASLDPKTVTVKSTDADVGDAGDEVGVAVASDMYPPDSGSLEANAVNVQIAASETLGYSAEDLELLDHLLQTENLWGRGFLRRNKDNLGPNREEIVEAVARGFSEREASLAVPSPLVVCDRPTRQAIMQYAPSDAPCPAFDPSKPLLLLEGGGARGRTGNNLVEFLHAVQVARDREIQLGTTAISWAAKLLSQFFFSGPDMNLEDKLATMEGALCMKVFRTDAELEGLDIVHMSTQELFMYKSTTPVADYIPSQLDVFRRLFSHVNIGEGGTSVVRSAAYNMCGGIDAVFPSPESRRTAIYTVIHSRSLEGAAGLRIMGKVGKHSGCDRTAALEMQPEYVKGILEPLGMLDRPVILITDGENSEVARRLQEDPDIGPVLRLLGPGESSLGGDVTLAVMSDVFIGNPASSFSSFIVKARLALGKGHNELWLKREEGQWRSVCGDHCIFDWEITGAQA